MLTSIDTEQGSLNHTVGCRRQLVPSRRAAISGTANHVITLAYYCPTGYKDFARSAARLVDDDNWSKFSIISGSDITLSEIVTIAEKTTSSMLSATLS